MAAQSDWWWNFRPTGYNALAWSGSEGNAAQRFLLCSVVLKPTHTQLSPGKFLYYLWEIISESITDADEEASFRYGSDTDRMVGMSNPAVWIIHSDQPHSPTWGRLSLHGVHHPGDSPVLRTSPPTVSGLPGEEAGGTVCTMCTV